MDSQTPLNHIQVEAFLQNVSSFANSSVEGVVLFADLVGSTDFKIQHSQLQGLAKTLEHNYVISAQIDAHNGRVVKYIGDSVMGLFLGTTAPEQALACANAILRGITSANQKRGWIFPFAMSTRIGVHGGQLWMFKYKESPFEDPQGTTVDIAARLTKVAGCQQIVCSDELFQKAGGTTLYPDVANAIIYPIKGVPAPFAVRFMSDPAPTTGDVSGQHRHPTLSKYVKEAKEHITNDKPKEAVRLLTRALEEDAFDFHALLTKAKLLLYQLEVDPHHPNSDIKDETLFLLTRAALIKPHSPRLLLLRAKAYYTLAKNARREDKQMFLTRAIEDAEAAHAHAEDAFNTCDYIDAKTSLALYLAAYIQHFEDPQNDKILRALDLCKGPEDLISKVTNNLLKHYLTTHALVKLAYNTEISYVEIDEMLGRVEKLDKHFGLLHEARLEVGYRQKRATTYD